MEIIDGNIVFATNYDLGICVSLAFSDLECMSTDDRRCIRDSRGGLDLWLGERVNYHLRGCVGIDEYNKNEYSDHCQLPEVREMLTNSVKAVFAGKPQPERIEFNYTEFHVKILGVSNGTEGIAVDTLSILEEATVPFKSKVILSAYTSMIDNLRYMSPIDFQPTPMEPCTVSKQEKDHTPSDNILPDTWGVNPYYLKYILGI